MLIKKAIMDGQKIKDDAANKKQQQQINLQKFKEEFDEAKEEFDTINSESSSLADAPYSRRSSFKQQSEKQSPIAKHQQQQQPVAGILIDIDHRLRRKSSRVRIKESSSPPAGGSSAKGKQHLQHKTIYSGDADDESEEKEIATTSVDDADQQKVSIPEYLSDNFDYYETFSKKHKLNIYQKIIQNRKLKLIDENNAKYKNWIDKYKSKESADSKPQSHHNNSHQNHHKDESHDHH
jgi:hypothetical protein